jgi:hypothetical protein
LIEEKRRVLASPGGRSDGLAAKGVGCNRISLPRALMRRKITPDESGIRGMSVEVVVDDVQFALFAEPGGEEVFEHKTAYHAESFVEQIDDFPLGDSEPFQYQLKMFGEHLLAIRRPFVFLRPFDEVADSLIGAGNTHVEVPRISVSSVSSVGLQDTGSHRQDYNFPRIACHPKAFSSASIEGGRLSDRPRDKLIREGVQYSSSGIRLAYSAS